MAGSQLKRLKSSLRERGVIGPQQSKKQRRKNAQDKQGSTDRRLARSEALENIREQFNPFQFKTSARGPKFQVTTNQPASERAARGIKGRPGLAKSTAEERRKQTLLVEMQRRNKVGGILDRRWGEDDPTMSEDQKALERFAREKMRSHSKKSIFDLEEDEPSEGLTHLGRALDFGDGEEEEDGEKSTLKDDFDEADLGSDAGSDMSLDTRKRLKRLMDDVAGSGEEEPLRKKSKKEVMDELIAKSKQYKYERQVAKDEDEEMRAAIDKELPDIQALLFSRERPQPSTEHNKPLAAGVDGALKQFDLEVRKLAADKRAHPSERTKTEEEKAKEGADRLKELEQKRLKRMRGEPVSEDDDDSSDHDDEDENGGRGLPSIHPDRAIQIMSLQDDAEAFGLGPGIKSKRPTAAELGFDDEDDFILDDDLIASGSDLDLIEDDDESGSEEREDEDAEDEADDGFTRGLLTEEESKSALFQVELVQGKASTDGSGIPFTFPCPQSHEELLGIIDSNKLETTKLPLMVQRIRALYHPRLDSSNKQLMANFSRALLDHVVWLAEQPGDGQLRVLEELIRHLHSLAKSWPIEIAQQFRLHLAQMGEARPLALTKSDLVVLTAIGVIFPPSDFFNQVTTPATLTMARYLGQVIPKTLAQYATGIYLSILALEHQKLAKRYMPELMNFTLNTLCAFAPERPEETLGLFPVHEPANGMRIQGGETISLRKLTLKDCEELMQPGVAHVTQLKLAIVHTGLLLLKAASETWSKHPAFYETFGPFSNVLEHLSSEACRMHLPAALNTEVKSVKTHVERILRLATLARRPLELHHHRPLAIKTSIPKFEDTFDPDKHYDPNRERSELAKLRNEFKKERKGAMRELRRDAQFVARENLRAKKVRDEAYEKKFRRIVAEIQGEEGAAANEYAREKNARQRAKGKGR